MAAFPDELERILDGVASGDLSPASAARRLKGGEVRYLDEFAVLDLGRADRKGVPEVVYARAKSPDQVAAICAALLGSRERVIVSSPTPEHEAKIRETLPDAPLRRAGRSLVLGSASPSRPAAASEP
jgi:NCAIR mutase (PurE)-related protein